MNPIFVAKSPDQGWPGQFFVIIANNPRSITDPSPDATSRTELRRTLSRLRSWKHPVASASPDWKNREDGYAVGDLDLKKTIELGRRFERDAIFEIENDMVWLIRCSDGSREKMARWSERLYAPSDEPRSRIYVIRLDDSVLKVKRFREANPDHKPGKPCYYVGMTGKSPEERFADHKSGHKDCVLVRDYGLHPAWKKFEHIPLLSQADAETMEIKHANHLRSQGFAVWQN